MMFVYRHKKVQYNPIIKQRDCELIKKTEREMSKEEGWEFLSSSHSLLSINYPLYGKEGEIKLK